METVKAIEDDVVTLPDSRLDPSRTNIVRARRIVVSGAVSLPGQSIALYASEVVFQAPGSIDTSGGPPDRDYTNAPVNNTAPDPTVGKTGASGSTGKGGGTIRIWAERIIGPVVLRSIGGPGGRGQNGGQGPRGPKGQDAPQGMRIQPSNMGQPGGRGLVGGTAGTSGDGGKGGGIDMGYVQTKPNSFQVDARGGKGGAGASGGPGGTGGPGGAGGPYGHFKGVVHYINGMPYGAVQQDGVSPVAATGPVGPAAPNGPDGATGSPGVVQVHQISFDDFCRSATSSHLTLLTAAGEAFYRNAEFEAAADVLGYVYHIAQQKGAIGGAH